MEAPDIAITNPWRYGGNYDCEQACAMKTSPQDLIWQTLQRAIRCLLPLHQNLAYPPSNPILLESGHLLCIIWLLPMPLKFTKLWTIHEACIGFHLIFKRCTWECRKNMDGKLELVYACFCGDFSAFCFRFIPTSRRRSLSSFFRSNTSCSSAN